MRPNPLIPVKVVVKSLGINMPDNYTRVFGIVSFGDTNTKENTIIKVSRSEVADLQLKKGSYTESFLNSFFANNNQGSIYVLETKKALSEEVSKEESKVKHYAAGDYYISDNKEDNKAYKCLKDDVALSESDLTPSKLLDSSYWQETEEKKTYSVNDLYTDISSNKIYKCIQEDVAASLLDLIPEHLKDKAYWIDITKKTDIDSIKNAINVLKDFIDNGEIRVYEWACPTIFYAIEDFIDLVKSYNDIIAGQYFSIELPEGTDPSKDETFSLYAKSKSFIPVYPSLYKKESVNGAIAGIKSSNIYNLNNTNPLSLLQYKKVNGITPRDKLKNSLIAALNNNGCSWVGTFNNNTLVLGGMVGDGKNWDFYFALDTYVFRLMSDISTMMINASNNPRQAIKFNPNGISIVKNKLVSISSNMLQIGVLDDFGSDYNEDEHAILNSGEWGYIDFANYKASQYDNFKKGIYDGAYCYAAIGSFILQVVPNITVE